MKDFTVVLVYQGTHGLPTAETVLVQADDSRGAVLAAIEETYPGLVPDAAVAFRGDPVFNEYDAERLQKVLKAERAARAVNVPLPPATTRVLACSCDAPVTLTREADGCSRGVCDKCGAVLTILHRTPTP